MKKSVIFLFILSFLAVFLSVSFVSAIVSCEVRANACNAGEVKVMGLSGTTNAHGQLATAEPAYTQLLCCTNEVGDLTAQCDATSSNKIVGLSGPTNAHAEIPDGSAYPASNSVCYGFLECGTTCDENHLIQVLSLSAPATNAHLGTFSTYTTKICCKDNTPAPGLKCDLTSAGWASTQATTNAPVRMLLGGALVGGEDSCIDQGLGAEVKFSIYKKVFLGGIFGNQFITNVTGNYDYGEWKPTEAGTYYFIARATFSEDKFSSQDAVEPDIAELEVVTGDPDPCISIDKCEDYTNNWPSDVVDEEIFACNSDPDTCNVAKDDGRINPNPPAGYSFGCGWNTQTNTCNFTEVLGGTRAVKLKCENGYTLCTKSDTYVDYCYPNNVCPSGDMPLDSEDFGECNIGDGCSNTFACSNGDQGSCSQGNLCQGGKCFGGPTVTISSCVNGFKLCERVGGLNYCYPGVSCASGDVPAETNVCTLPAVDQGGICVDTGEAVGKCTYSYVSAQDNCDDGFLTYSWTASWSGTGTRPPTCGVGSATIECPAQIPLPLFTPINAIITVVTIVAVYLIMALTKKSHKKKIQHKKI